MRHRDEEHPKLRRPTVRHALLAAAAALLPAAVAAGAGPSHVGPSSLLPKVVNGVETHEFPSVVLVQTPIFCTGTLIGCETVLTAAHCVCFGESSSGCGIPDPERMRVFAQHGKTYGVAGVAVHPDYRFGETSDLAVLKLGEAVTGIAPSPLNTAGRPEKGTSGVLAGFGMTVNHGSDDFSDLGIKRWGRVTTVECGKDRDDTHLCWDFAAPLGDPGEDSSSCRGDFGGPVFVDSGGGPVVAGVTSGAPSADCQPAVQGFAADVFLDLDWIRGAAGPDLDATACGDLPQAFDPGTEVLFGGGSLGPGSPADASTFEVPAGTALARATLNAEEGLGKNDFDLFVKAGDPATTTDFDCGPRVGGLTPEFCELPSPAPGTWHVLVDRVAGAGRFQTTVTLFEEEAGEAEDAGEAEEADDAGCAPDATTLCLHGGRFRVEVDWETDTGTGQGHVVPGGTRDSSNLWFFSPANWEMLIKVLDGCAVDGRFWVLFAATTDVGFTVTVTDTRTDEVKVYTNPRGHAADAVIDTSAFATCG